MSQDEVARRLSAVGAKVRRGKLGSVLAVHFSKKITTDVTDEVPPESFGPGAELPPESLSTKRPPESRAGLLEAFVVLDAPPPLLTLAFASELPDLALLRCEGGSVMSYSDLLILSRVAHVSSA